MRERYSEGELEQKLREALRSFIEKKIGASNPQMPKENVELAIPEILFDQPNFASVVVSYASLRSQEKSEKQNRYLQKWLIVFSGIATAAVIVPILVEVISKFA
jgi:hypothetical protein